MGMEDDAIEVYCVGKRQVLGRSGPFVIRSLHGTELARGNGEFVEFELPDDGPHTIVIART